MEIKTETIKYDSEWEKFFKSEAKKIKKALGKNCVAVHHIRDTSFKSDVCVLNGKITIFAMAVVKNIEASTLDFLREIGYKQEVHEGYKKEGDPEIILWITPLARDNEAIMCELSLRDYMAAHPEKAKEYAEYIEKEALNSADILSLSAKRESYFEKLRPEIDKWVKEQNNFSFGLSMGMCFGMSIGTAIGAAMGNIAIGMTMGMSVGMCLGIAIGSAKNKK